MMTDAALRVAQPLADPPRVARDLDLLACPLCGGHLALAGDALACAACVRRYPIQDGIAQLFVPNEWDASKRDVTPLVKTFYEEHPFPNYDAFDSVQSFLEKARRGVFARLLDEQLPPGVRILEAGCGTGQLSNYLGMTPGRRVIGAGLSMSSLRLGAWFARENKIDQVTFCQMNLFRPPFRPGSFHLVISNGVLHHTSDPEGGFRRLAELVKPGGFVIIGLYNSVARIPTQLRRAIFRLSGDRWRGLDSRLRIRDLAEEKKRAWFMDQYKHPCESTHRMGDVLAWFRRAGVAFVNSIPHPRAFESFSSDERLFAVHPVGTRVDRAIVQLGMLLAGGRDGGLFMMIGRRGPSAR